MDGLFTCEDLGTHELKGIPALTQAWRITGLQHEATPRQDGSPLVGRQEELGLLMRAWEASKQGHGQVVFVQGEPGVGKSRLLDAMRAELHDGRRLWVLSIDFNPLAGCSTTCPPADWRTPHHISSFNSILERAVAARGPYVTFVDLARFSRPLWDAAPDWNHPPESVTLAQSAHLLDLILPPISSAERPLTPRRETQPPVTSSAWGGLLRVTPRGH